MSNEIRCFECSEGNLVPDTVDLTGYRDGEEFTVSVPGLRCSVCDFKTISNEQSAEFTRAVSDAYRKAHGLLRGSEIKFLRAQLKMSQQEFASYLGVGVASVKRWECGQVQDKAMDELIRLKADINAARNNLEALEQDVADYVLSTVQSYKRQSSMYLDRSKMDSMVDVGEPVAA